MSNSIVKQQSGLTTHFSAEQVALLKSHLMSFGKTGTPPSDADLQLYGLVCQRLQLDPFAKHIFAIQRKGKWSFEPSIDGYRAIADRTGIYAGCDEPLYDEGLTLWEFEQTGRNLPKVCKITVYKMVGGQRCPFVGVVRYQEYVQVYNGKVGELWEKQPLNMLAVAAERQALRKAFSQCNAAQTEIEMVEAPPQPVDDEWRIKAFEWGISQGVDMNAARQIANNAATKAEALQQLKAALQKQIPVAEVETVQ